MARCFCRLFVPLYYVFHVFLNKRVPGLRAASSVTHVSWVTQFQQRDIERTDHTVLQATNTEPWAHRSPTLKSADSRDLTIFIQMTQVNVSSSTGEVHGFYLNVWSGTHAHIRRWWSRYGSNVCQVLSYIWTLICKQLAYKDVTNWVLCLHLYQEPLVLIQRAIQLTKECRPKDAIVVCRSVIKP